MANEKLTDKTELLTPADDDFLYIVDVSDTTDSPEGTSKKIKKSNVSGNNQVYSKIVYVNAVSPNTATIFDLNNPPITNDNSLKADVANLYVGTDSSGWVYNSSLLSYTSKPITSVIGTGASGQVSYWNGVNSQTGSPILVWKLNKFGVGTGTPQATLDVLNGVAVNALTSYFTAGNSDANFRLGFRNGSGSAANTEQGALVFDYSSTNVTLGKIGFIRGTGLECIAITFGLGVAGAPEIARMFASGGMSIGSATDPGAGNLSASGLAGIGTRQVTVDSTGKLLASSVQSVRALVFDNTAKTPLTGTTAFTIIASYTIPANTIPANALLRVSCRLLKTGVAGTMAISINTSNASSSAGMRVFNGIQSAATNLFMEPIRHISIKGGQGYGFTTTGSFITDITASTNAITSQSFNVAIANTFYVWAQLGSAADTIDFEHLLIELINAT